MQPKIYLIDQHRIPSLKIDKHAYYVIKKLRHHGFVAYLVGGSVRDLLLEKAPKDFDISTSAKPEEIKKIFPNCILIGKRFRLAHIRFGKKILEVSTFRSGDNEKSSLILRDNIWGNPEEDVLRRDFTINGLFYDPETQTIIDYVGGFPDIEKKILRAIGKPNIRFIQDPVRMIRLIKFRSRFGFDIDKDTHEALLECKEEIIKSSPARVLEELFRMLESGSSKDFFRLLAEYGLLQKLMPILGDYLLEEKDNAILQFLEKIDEINKQNYKKIDRSILVSSLLFPLLEERIKMHFIENKKVIHLGIIAEEVKSLLLDIFRPFFYLPRRMKAAIVSILTNQFRFTPIEDKKKKKLRIPKDPFFNLAISFFQIRSILYTDLQPTYNNWHKLSKKVKFSQRKYQNKAYTKLNPNNEKK